MEKQIRQLEKTVQVVSNTMITHQEFLKSREKRNTIKKLEQIQKVSNQLFVSEGEKIASDCNKYWTKESRKNSTPERTSLALALNKSYQEIQKLLTDMQPFDLVGENAIVSIRDKLSMLLFSLQIEDKPNKSKGKKNAHKSHDRKKGGKTTKDQVNLSYQIKNIRKMIFEDQALNLQNIIQIISALIIEIDTNGNVFLAAQFLNLIANASKNKDLAKHLHSIISSFSFQNLLEKVHYQYLPEMNAFQLTNSIDALKYIQIIAETTDKTIINSFLDQAERLFPEIEMDQNVVRKMFNAIISFEIPEEKIAKIVQILIDQTTCLLDQLTFKNCVDILCSYSKYSNQNNAFSAKLIDRIKSLYKENPNIIDEKFCFILFSAYSNISLIDKEFESLLFKRGAILSKTMNLKSTINTLYSIGLLHTKNDLSLELQSKLIAKIKETLPEEDTFVEFHDIPYAFLAMDQLDIQDEKLKILLEKKGKNLINREERYGQKSSIISLFLRKILQEGEIYDSELVALIQKKGTRMQIENGRDLVSILHRLRYAQKNHRSAAFISFLVDNIKKRPDDLLLMDISLNLRSIIDHEIQDNAFEKIMIDQLSDKYNYEKDDTALILILEAMVILKIQPQPLFNKLLKKVSEMDLQNLDSSSMTTAAFELLTYLGIIGQFPDLKKDYEDNYKIYTSPTTPSSLEIAVEKILLQKISPNRIKKCIRNKETRYHECDIIVNDNVIIDCISHFHNSPYRQAKDIMRRDVLQRNNFIVKVVDTELPISIDDQVNEIIDSLGLQFLHQ